MNNENTKDMPASKHVKSIRDLQVRAVSIQVFQVTDEFGNTDLTCKPSRSYLPKNGEPDYTPNVRYEHLEALARVALETKRWIEQNTHLVSKPTEGVNDDVELPDPAHTAATERSTVNQDTLD